MADVVTCSTCKQEKPYSDFYKRVDSPRPRKICKKCAVLATIAHREKNRKMPHVSDPSAIYAYRGRMSSAARLGEHAKFIAARNHLRAAQLCRAIRASRPDGDPGLPHELVEQVVHLLRSVHDIHEEEGAA